MEVIFWKIVVRAQKNRVKGNLDIPVSQDPTPLGRTTRPTQVDIKTLLSLSHKNEHVGKGIYMRVRKIPVSEGSPDRALNFKTANGFSL